MRNRKKKSSTENTSSKPETTDDKPAEETSSNVIEEPKGTEIKAAIKPQRSCLGKCIRYIFFGLLFVFALLALMVFFMIFVIPRILAEIEVFYTLHSFHLEFIIKVRGRVSNSLYSLYKITATSSYKCTFDHMFTFKMLS